MQAAIMNPPTNKKLSRYASPNLNVNLAKPHSRLQLCRALNCNYSRRSIESQILRPQRATLRRVSVLSCRAQWSLQGISLAERRNARGRCGCFRSVCQVDL